MAITMECPYCARRFQVSDEKAGKKVKCSCKKVLEVPEKTEFTNFLDEELDVKTDPVICTDPDEWIEAMGATPEIAEQLQKRMKVSPASNSKLMAGLAGAVLVILLVVVAVVMMVNKQSDDTSMTPSSPAEVSQPFSV